MGADPRRPRQLQHPEPHAGAPQLDAKKKSLSATEQDPATRAVWREAIAALASERFVFVDEFGVTIALTRRYARAPRGERARDAVPAKYGTSTSVSTSLTLDGMGATLAIEGAVDTVVFLTYVRDLLAPTLQPGQIVIIDNLRCHKDDQVRAVIEAAGCRVLFLPPYSPDFNPIELAIAKLKEFLRAVGARTQEALDTAIAQALDAVTAADALGWFKHRGYQPASSI